MRTGIAAAITRRQFDAGESHAAAVKRWESTAENRESPANCLTGFAMAAP
jgi:hypothetical protein